MRARRSCRCRRAAHVCRVCVGKNAWVNSTMLDSHLHLDIRSLSHSRDVAVIFHKWKSENEKRRQPMNDVLRVRTERREKKENPQCVVLCCVYVWFVWRNNVFDDIYLRLKLKPVWHVPLTQATFVQLGMTKTEQVTWNGFSMNFQFISPQTRTWPFAHQKLKYAHKR